MTEAVALLDAGLGSLVKVADRPEAPQLELDLMQALSDEKLSSWAVVSDQQDHLFTL